MNRAAVGVACLTAVVAGCATLRVGERRDADGRLDRGLAALAANDFATAKPLLEGVYLEHWQEPVGQRALLALAAAELDSRNVQRRLWVGAELAGRYLSLDHAPAWSIPAAETLYLLALELGAREEELARAEETRQAAEAERADALQALSTTQRPELPRSERESVPAMIRRMTAEHAREKTELQKRVSTLEERLAAREQELKDAQEELERIRRTLRR